MVLRALDVLVHRMGRQDVHVALLGFGDSYPDLVALAGELRLTDYVTFTGRADQRMIAAYLSTADVGLSPDPRNPLNDVSTMNKTMEYMSFAVPVVAFDLTETRVSAGEAAVYVEPSGDAGDDVDRYAKAISELLDDCDRRVAMAVAARRRAEAVLDWAPQRRRYVEVYERLLGAAQGGQVPLPDPPAADAGEAGPAVDRFGNELIDLQAPGALERYLRDRAVPGDCSPP